MKANQENFFNLSFVQANLNKSQMALSDLEHKLSLWSEPETKIHIALLQEPHVNTFVNCTVVSNIPEGYRAIVPKAENKTTRTNTGT